MQAMIPYPPLTLYRYIRRCSGRLLLLCSLLLLATGSYAAGPEDPEFDEITVYLTVTGVGSTEVPAIIYKEYAYLSVSHVFDFLHIGNRLSATGDSISGFFLKPDQYYVIDKPRRRLVVGGQTVRLKEQDVFVEDGLLFLKSTYFGSAFGLACSFQFRSLTVVISTQLELPVVREMRQESMRNNMRRLRGEAKVDTLLPGRRPLFHAGAADWSVITTQNSQGDDNTRFNFALGTVLAGGETTLGINYDSYAGFTHKQQYYLWRLVNNERKGMRQLMVGKINPQATATLFAPVVGVQVTNAPTTYRRSFGSYVLSDRTEPNWMVELYVNNVLVNYVKADAAGFFSFDVPLVYGNSAVKLRFYGPYGEERTTEQNINVPFQFLPKGQVEYTASAGMVEDSVHSRYGRASVSYGLGKRITIGGGAEYLSTVTSGPYMPFVNASVRLASNLLLSGDYMYGVRMKQVLSYRLPSDLQFELMYSRYKQGQRAINNTFLEERRAVVSYPFRGKRLSVFSRLTVYQILLPPAKGTGSSRYTNIEALFSGMLWGVNTNFTTYAMVTNAPNPFVYSNLSATLRLPATLLFTPQVQFEYNTRQLMSYKGELGKYLSSKGYAHVFYEHNIRSQFKGVGIGLRYDLSFAQASVSGRRTNDVTTTVQSARGSFFFNGNAGYFNANNRSSVGKGGILIAPFLDLNANGRRDAGERRVSGLRVQVNAGRLRLQERDTTILVTDLEAYVNYTVRLSTDAFEQGAWQIRNKVVGIGAQPNQLRVVEIPVLVMGEIGGTVMRGDSTGTRGLGRLIVRLYNAAGREVGNTLSESDGYFTFGNLAPGVYTVRVDAAQLGKLGMRVDQAVRSCTIHAIEEGSVVNDMNFLLTAAND